MFYFFVSLIAILFIFFDVNYFIRIIFTVLVGRFFEKRIKITDPTTIYGFCFTQDLDIAGRHMNNARFVRDLDFARFHFYDRTGLYEQMCRLHTDAVQGATSIRYRRVIPIFTFYKVTSQLVYWDEKAFYVEQRFITPYDGFVRAAVLSKQVMLRASADEMVRALAGEVAKPEPTKDLRLWIESMDASSERLRPHKN